MRGYVRSETQDYKVEVGMFGDFTPDDRRDLKDLVKGMAVMHQWRESHELHEKEYRDNHKEQHKCLTKKMGDIAKAREEGDNTLHDRIGTVIDKHIKPLAASVNMGKGIFRTLIYVGLGLGSLGTALSFWELFGG